MHPSRTDISALPSRIGFIGAGRLATTLAIAWTRAGVLVVGAASRSYSSACSLVEQCEHPEIRAFESAQALADSCHMLFITVPDDQIATVVADIRWHPGQSVVHCSGATQVGVLAPAENAGAAIAGFHPLQLFSNPTVALQHLAGSSVAIEASGKLDAELTQLAAVSGLRPLRLPPGARVAYHAAGNLAASCLLGVIKEAVDIWEHCGLPRDEALSALMPLSMGTLASAREAGLDKALSGPVSRGDINVIRAHLDAIRASTGNTRLYEELLERLVGLALRAGRIGHDQAREFTSLIDTAHH